MEETVKEKTYSIKWAANKTVELIEDPNGEWVLTHLSPSDKAGIA